MDGGTWRGISCANMSSTGDSTTAALLKGDSNVRKGDSKTCTSSGDGGDDSHGGSSTDGTDDEYAESEDDELAFLTGCGGGRKYTRREQEASVALQIKLYEEEMARRDKLKKALEAKKSYDEWYEAYAGPLRKRLNAVNDNVEKIELLATHLALQLNLRWREGEETMEFNPKTIGILADIAINADEGDTPLVKDTPISEPEKAALNHIIAAFKADPSSVGFSLDVEFQMMRTEPAPLIAAAVLIGKKEKARLKNAADKARAKERAKMEAATQAAAKPLAQQAQRTQSNSTKSETMVSCAEATNVGHTLKNTMGPLTSMTLDKCTASVAPTATTTIKDTHARSKASA